MLIYKKVLVVLIQFLSLPLFAVPLLKLQTNYNSNYDKKSEKIKSSLNEYARLKTSYLSASIYTEQNAEYDSFSDTTRYGIEAKCKNIDVGNSEVCFKASSLNLSYSGLLSRMKNQEKLLTSSSPLSASINAPRGISSHIPTISSSKKEKSFHFETSIESDKTTTYTDFTLFDLDNITEKKEFAASFAETLLFDFSNPLLSTVQVASYKTEQKSICDLSLALSNKALSLVSVMDSVQSDEKIFFTSTSAASVLINADSIGSFIIQGGFFKGNEKSKIKNMESLGLIYDFFNNRVRIGSRVVRTEKQDEETTKYLFGLRYHEGNLALSLVLSDVQNKQSAIFSASNKVNTIRLSLNARASNDKDSDEFTASVRTGIRAEDYLFAQCNVGASINKKDGEIKKRTADTNILFSFGSDIIWIGKISFNVAF